MPTLKMFYFKIVFESTFIDKCKAPTSNDYCRCYFDTQIGN